ncbi:MAG: ATP-binding protein [Fervidicoccaceae archaeon]
MNMEPIENEGNEEEEINEEELEEIGYIIGESTPFKVLVLSRTPPNIGEYVLIKHQEGHLLGMVEDSIAGNPFIPENLTNIVSFENWRNIVDGRNYTRGVIRILTKIQPLLRGRRFEPPRNPPAPSSPVFKANDEILKRIFLPSDLQDDSALYHYSRSEKKGYVRIGVLANHPNVPVFINVDSLVSRHSAILAVTGAGKSNTVSILAERMVEGLGATILLFDMHSEYTESRIADRRTNIIKPRINPSSLTIWELYKLARIREDAVKQQSVLRYAYKKAREHMSELLQSDPAELSKFDIIDYMMDVLECLESFSEGAGRRSGSKSMEESREREEKRSGVKDPCSKLSNIPKKLDRDVVLSVEGKLEDLKDVYKDIISIHGPKSIKEIVKQGYLNIVDLGEVDDVGSDVVASYLLRRILEERKAYVRNREPGYPVPVYIFIEEAHILVPRDYDTLTKEIVSKIAREGRKFGVGISLVSQRPKSIDENSLSQTNNKIILKIVEPNDLKYVQNSSELLSDELLSMLPSLRTGEAILLGEFTKLPALVKIDEHLGKRAGRDLNIAELWQKNANITLDQTKEEIEDMLYPSEGPD